VITQRSASSCGDVPILDEALGIGIGLTSSYPSGMEIGRISFGNGGWVRLGLRTRAKPDPFVLVRVEEDERDRMRVCEIYIRGRLSDPMLRALPIRQIEDLLSSPDFIEPIRRRLPIPGCDLETASSYYGTAFGPGAVDTNGRGVHWAAEMLISQFPPEDRGRPADERPPGLAPQPRPAGPVIGVARPPVVEPPSWRRASGHRARAIEVPTSRRYPNDFYEHIAESYHHAVADGIAPAPHIASLARPTPPITTVHRWIREARKRGLLAPTRR
jgi:hypothetical protein